jgi:hypothetical protein
MKNTKDCGCGSSLCDGGWIYYGGTEYPCNGPQKKEVS